MKENKKNKKIILIAVGFFALFLLLITSTKVTAVDEYALMEALPGMETSSTPGLGVYLQNIFNIGLGIAGVLAVIMITIGGVLYMTTEAVGGKSSAKSMINNAVLGLVLALASFLLLKTINPLFTDAPLTLQPVPAPLETPPPVADGRWYGYYKCGETGAKTLCVGDTLPLCQTNCKKCPVITDPVPCNFDSGLLWVGSCVVGGKKVEVGGTEGGGETMCKEEYKDACTQKEVITVQTCEIAGGGTI